MPGPDVSFIIEEGLPLAGRDPGAVIGYGEANVMVFLPGAPFDQAICPGMNDYMTKPFEFTELYKRIITQLENPLHFPDYRSLARSGPIS